MSKLPKVFAKTNKDNIEAYTPKYAVDILLPYLYKLKNKLGGELKIWAPFSRDEHNYANYLREKGFSVVNTHYDPETGEGEDFLLYEPDFEFDIIIDNPPFKNKTKFIEKVLSYKKPFALFLPIHALGDMGTTRLFIEEGIEVQNLIPDQRTEFHNQANNGISFKTIYICSGVLDKGLELVKMNKIKLITGEE